MKWEQEYAAHRRRLADDLKRLEQRGQRTLSSLQFKEAELMKRKEFLEWELEQEMEQDMSEKINSWEDMKLKVELEKDPNNLKNIKKQVQNELDKIDWDHVKEKGDFETRLRISEKKKEYEEVESELEAGINQ
ncbi:unnamed protein product [Allacma fusca]|uniref:Uncharacterized protein n=1 Tax=Allacma fusca TaxID=39272 RepID=A0A8J2J415_9HEXA|nr:unnamed protein product [Allacma fusca]